MEVKERKSKKKHPSKIVGSPEDLTKRHSTKPKTDTHVGQKSDGGLDSQPKKKKKQKEAVSQKPSPNVSIAVNTPVDQVGERKRRKKKKQLSNIGESQEDLIQKHPTEQKASDVHLGEKSQGGLDNQPKKKKKKKEKEAVSQETNAGASIAVNTPADHVGVGKKKKKRLSNIGESPEDLILKHPTKQKALDIHGGEESQGGLDNQPKKKKKKKGKEAASQEASAGVSIAVNASVDQVGHRKKKKKQPSDVGEIPEDLIQKHPTKHKALAFHVGENSEGGLDNQPKKEEEEELREAILQETSAGVSSAVDTTPVDQVGGRKKRKKHLSDIGESPEDLIQGHPTKQKALAFHVGEKSEGSLDNQSKKKKKKKKKKEEEAVPQETSPGVSNPENTLVDQVGEEAERKRMKKQLSKIGGSSEDLTQKLPTKRKASEFSVGQESDGGPDNRPKKKKKKAKEAVSQASSPGVAIAGNAPVDRQMRPETALTTPLDQRMKPETILVTPDTSLPNSSTLITPDTALPISLGRGGTTTASIQTTAGQMSKHKLTTARSFFVKGGLLDQILEKLSRAIESAKHTKGQVRDNIWFKKFSMGVNDVTRTLERMPPALCKSNMNDVSDIEHLKNVQEAMQHFPALQDSHLEDKGPGKQSTGSLGKPDQLVQLQAVLVAHDCHPRVLIGHLPLLASSRGVPLLYVEDHGKGSLRLGEILMLRAAIAIGIKVGESPINKTMQDILDDQSTRYQKQ